MFSITQFIAKNMIFSVFFILLNHCSVFGNPSPASPPLTEIPGGALFGEYHSLVFPEGITELKGPTVITVDELVINGTLVTNGRRLRIDVRRLVFGPQGIIQGFATSAPGTLEAREGSPGNPGRDATTTGGGGGQGEVGKTGETGHLGINGADVGEISIFAASVQGFQGFL